jgi:hypothetical protein
LAANVYRAPLFEGEAETVAGYFLGDFARRKAVPDGEYAFEASTKDRTVGGRLDLTGGRGVLEGFPDGAVTIVDIVMDGKQARLIGVSQSGLVNIWLESGGGELAGRWGYDKPANEFRLKAGMAGRTAVR